MTKHKQHDALEALAQAIYTTLESATTEASDALNYLRDGYDQSRGPLDEANAARGTLLTVEQRLADIGKMLAAFDVLHKGV